MHVRKYKQYVGFLKDLPMFKDFHSNELLILAQHLKERKFDEGQVVFRKNDSGNSCYLISSGSVIVVKEQDENEMEILYNMGVGEMFGQISLLDGKARMATCVAHEPLVLLELEKRDFDCMFEMSESFAFRFQKYLTGVMISHLNIGYQKLATLIE